MSRLPYPGLRSFDREEADLFFGRDGAVNHMVDKLAGTGFLAVIGASGTGKSSLVRTGLLDGLELGLHPAGADWRFAVFTPGGQPLTNLARALLRSEAVDGGDAGAGVTNGSGADDPLGPVALLEGQLRRGPYSILEWQHEGGIGASGNLLILVDQFEEVFRFASYADREDAEAFVKLLIVSASEPGSRVHVVITMRSEFLGACALIPGLAETLNRGCYLTPRMSREECRQAIIGPAKLVGATIDPVLVTRLLNDLASFAPWDRESTDNQLRDLSRRADQLPLMQHLLNRMWKHAQPDEAGRITLKLADYEALGGLEGALDAHGAEILEEFNKEERVLVERIFRALVDDQTLTSATRRPLPLGDLAAEVGADHETVARLVEPFRADDCNFLRPGAAEKLGVEKIIDISHESLIRQWSALSAWVTEEARAANLWRRLERAAERHERGEDELLSGLALANLASWWREDAPSPQWARRYSTDYDKVARFLAESEHAQAARSEAKAERTRKERRRLQSWLAGVSALALLATLSAGWGYVQTEKAQANADDARHNLAIAGRAADQLAIGLIERFEDELRLPSQVKYDLIHDTEAALVAMSADRPAEAALLEKQIQFYLKSVRVLLAAGSLQQAALYAQKLAALVANTTDVGWTPPSTLATEVDLALARVARLSTRFDEAQTILDRIERRLAAHGRTDAHFFSARAEFLGERGGVHRARYQVGRQLEYDDALQDHAAEALRWFDDVTTKADTSERLQSTRALERVLVAAIRSRVDALILADWLDLARRNLRSPAEMLDQLQANLNLLRNIAPANESTVGLLAALVAERGALKAESLDNDVTAAYRLIAAAVKDLEELSANDPGNFEYRRHLLTALSNRAGYAMALGFAEQAEADLTAARSLAVSLQVSGGDTTAISEIGHWLDYAEFNVLAKLEGKNRQELQHLQARSRARTRHKIANSGLDQVVFSRWSLLGSWLALSPDTAKDKSPEEISQIVQEGLEQFHTEGLDEHDLYYALKHRNYIFVRLLNMDAKDLGSEMWLQYFASAISELHQLDEMSPEHNGWRLQMEYYMGRAARVHGLIGDSVGKALYHHEALKLGRALLKEEPESLNLFRSAAFNARGLLETALASNDRSAVLSDLEEYASSILGDPQFDPLWLDTEAWLSDLLVVTEDASELLRKEGAEAADDLVLLNRVTETVETGLARAEQTRAAEDPGEGGTYNGALTDKADVGESIGGDASLRVGPDMMSRLRELELSASEKRRGIGWIYAPVYPGSWRTLEGTEYGAMRHHLRAVLAETEVEEIQYIRKVGLPFYERGDLVEVQLERQIGVEGEDARYYTRLKSFLLVNGRLYELNGSSPPIYDANTKAPVQIEDPAAAGAYIRFFTTYVNGEDGAFQIVEHTSDLPWTENTSPAQVKAAGDALRPFFVWADSEEEDTWRATAAVHYGAFIFHAEFKVTQSGMIEMVNDLPQTEKLSTAAIKISDRAEGRGLNTPRDDNSANVDTIDYEELGLEPIANFVSEASRVITESLAMPAPGGDLLRAEYLAVLSDPEVHDGMGAMPLNNIAYTLLENDTEVETGLLLAAKAAELDPDNPNIADTYGLALLKTGDHEGALSVLKEAASELPDHAELLLHLGQAHRANGDMERAREALSLALQNAGTEALRAAAENELKGLSQ